MAGGFATQPIVYASAAIDAKLNEDTVIIARTDALAPNGWDDAIARARAYREAGADQRGQQLFGHVGLQCLLDFLSPNSVQVDRVRDVVGDRFDLHPVGDLQLFDDLFTSLCRNGPFAFRAVPISYTGKKNS